MKTKSSLMCRFMNAVFIFLFGDPRPNRIKRGVAGAALVAISTIFVMWSGQHLAEKFDSTNLLHAFVVTGVAVSIYFMAIGLLLLDEVLLGFVTSRQ